LGGGGMTPMEQILGLAEDGEEVLLCDGLEAALLGVQQTFEDGGIAYRAIYSLRRCVEVMVEGGLTYDDALEDLSFNTLGAYAGKTTPSFLLDLDLDEPG
jgi:hypothetical protein